MANELVSKTAKKSKGDNTMRKWMAALLTATSISPLAMAGEMSPRAALGYFSPTAVQLLETMEEERGSIFSDEEIRAVARSPEFQERLREVMIQKRLQKGPLETPRA